MYLWFEELNAPHKKLSGVGGGRQKMRVLQGQVLITSKSEQFGNFDGEGGVGGVQKGWGWGCPLRIFAPGVF